MGFGTVYPEAPLEYMIGIDLQKCTHSHFLKIFKL
jgi:hypothetical protein